MGDLKFKCPHCGQSLAAEEDMLGVTINCPSCQGAIELAGPEARPEEPRAPSALAEQITTCEACGASLSSEATLCASCGTDRRSDGALEQTGESQGSLRGTYQVPAVPRAEDHPPLRLKPDVELPSRNVAQPAQEGKPGKSACPFCGAIRAHKVSGDTWQDLRRANGFFVGRAMFCRNCRKYWVPPKHPLVNLLIVVGSAATFLLVLLLAKATLSEGSQTPGHLKLGHMLFCLTWLVASCVAFFRHLPLLFKSQAVAELEHPLRE